MKICLAMLIMLLAMPCHAREARKCGRLIAQRAEGAAVRGIEDIYVPFGCGRAVFRQPYIAVPGPKGTELWSGSKRLTLRMLAHPVRQQAQLASAKPVAKRQIAKPKPKRTLTKEWWDKDVHFTEREEF